MSKNLLLLLMFLPSCATLPRAHRNFTSTNPERDQRIYVASHGWHTGIILKKKNLDERIPSLAKRFPGSDFYEIGWGDAGFYQADKITAKITLNAVFLPSDTVVHLVGLKGDPIAYFDNSEVQNVSISSKGMNSLCDFLESSFERNENGTPKMLGVGLYGDSEFYKAQGRYHLFNGCNKWTAKALYSGGTEIEPLFKITSASVMNEICAPVRPSKISAMRKKGPR